MQTQNIPDEQWIDFLNRFSNDHVGWPATIEVLDGDTGPQKIASGLPLQGISFEIKGSRPCSLEISAGDDPNRQVTHVVDMPLHIREAEEAGGNIDLEIEPARGPITLIHLRGPMH
jgi:hypothetical protein